MSYTAGPGVLHAHSIDTISDGPLPPIHSSTDTTWPTADLAIYVPVIIRHRVVVRSIWFACGATGAGNYDIGLYDAAGVAILRRGSTAKPASSSEVVWDCTATTIGPGLYYVALTSSTNTDTFQMRSPTAPLLAAYGCYSETSALPLPATATFVVPNTLAKVPILGLFLNSIAT